MNRLYKEESSEFLAGLRRYMNDEIGYSEIKRLWTREDLAFKSREWGRMIEEKSGEILSAYNKIYRSLLSLEEKIKQAEKLRRGVEFEVDIDSVVGHSEMTGRNRVQPMGHEGSDLYVPPFPSLGLVSALNINKEARE